MISDKITLRNIKSIANVSVEFQYPETNLIVITGKNGVGKTSIIKAFHLLNDPQVYEKSAGLNSVRQGSEVLFDLEGYKPFRFSSSNPKGVLDSRDKLPGQKEVIAELPIPFGKRFEQFSLISNFDNEIRTAIAATQYKEANDLIKFLADVYGSEKFNELKEVSVKSNTFYFTLESQDYYIREDHFSSGEFFLIQLYRLISSGAKLVIVDELDVALDAAA